MRRILSWPVSRETLIVVALFGAAYLIGRDYTDASRRAGRIPEFYQSYFEPAVLMACGHGFVLTRDRPPALDDFLARRADAFDCAALPQPLATTEQGLYQYAWFYLMRAVGVTWSVVGVSWSGLAPLHGVLFATTIVAVYGIARVMVPWSVALGCAIAVMLSTLHLLNLPHLRDYAKAPFVLLLILLLVHLVRWPLAPRVLLGLAALYGVVLGIGYGFRTDLLANIPVFVVTLLFFTAGGVLRNWKWKLVAVATCAVAFVATSWPTLSYVVRRGGCQWHVVLLGLDTSFNDALGVKTPFYQWGSAYADEYVHTTLSSFVNRLHGARHLEYCSSEYDRASWAYLNSVLRTVPADFATRALASTIQVLDLPAPWPGAPLAGFLDGFYRWREFVLRHAAGIPLVAGLLALIIIGAVDRRLGLFAAFFVAYFGGYPSLQFANRHFFHLEFLGWLAIGFVAWQALRAIRTRPDRGFVRNAVAFSALLVAIVAAPLLLLRAYQQGAVDRLTREYLLAPRSPLAVASSADGHTVMVPPEALANIERDPMQGTYLEVRIDVDTCPQAVAIATRYQAPERVWGFSRPLRMTPDGTAPERIMLPVYRYFKGFDLGDTPASCIAGVSRIPSLERRPVLPVLTLPRDWDRLPAHQQLDLARLGREPASE